MSAATLTGQGYERRRRRATRRLWLLAAGGFALMLAPVVLFAGAGNPPCPSALVGASAAGPVPAGMFAAPLQLQLGRWYRAGATSYGGPQDPSSGSYGAIPDPAQDFLPAHPATFAELSVLAHNPANGGAFTFADANALDQLPYMTGLRVNSGGRELVLYKRDIGYGQGPGQTISNGQPYRLDVWWQAALSLGVTKTPVSIQLAPASGTSATLDELPATTPATGVCPTGTSGALTLTAGDRAQILPDGNAAAPADAPRAVKLAVAAANQIHQAPYSIGAAPVHYGTLAQLWPAYDCSGSVSYVLYRAGLHSEWPDVSGQLESWGQPGPGRWITVYANSGHVFIAVAGIVMNTAWYAPVIPTAPSSGPRWQPASTIPAQYAGDQYGGFVQRHPEGL
jgi:hypothetical protein